MLKLILCWSLLLNGCSSMNHKATYFNVNNIESNHTVYKPTEEAGYFIHIARGAIGLLIIYGLVYLAVQSPYVEER